MCLCDKLLLSVAGCMLALFCMCACLSCVVCVCVCVVAWLVDCVRVRVCANARVRMCVQAVGLAWARQFARIWPLG